MDGVLADLEQLGTELRKIRDWALMLQGPEELHRKEGEDG